MRLSWILVSAGFAISCSSSGGGASGAGGGSSSTSDGATASTNASTASAQASTSGAGGAGSGGSGQGGGSDTYANYADAFFVKYCVECHGAGAQQDFTKLAGITANAPTIRCGVAPMTEPNCGASPAAKQFPISDAKGTNPKPTDAERARIVAWIDDGLAP